MDIEALREFFMWCSIINGCLLIMMFIFTAFAGDLVYKTQSKFYPMPRETFNIVIYSFIGLFKLVFIALNLVPFLALSIVIG